MESKQCREGWGTEGAWIKDEIDKHKYWLGRKRVIVNSAVPETCRLLHELKPETWEGVLQNEIWVESKDKQGKTKGVAKGVSGRRWMHNPPVELLQKNSELFLMDLQIRYVLMFSSKNRFD